MHTSRAIPLLLAAALLLLASPATAGNNRIAGFHTKGAGQIKVTMAGKTAKRVDFTVPSAKVDLRCNRSGYRPREVRYGFAPLHFGIKRGHSRVKGYNPKKMKASVVASFPPAPASAKTSSKRDPLSKLRKKAIALCSKGAKGGKLTGRLDVDAVCKRVKMGFGKKNTHYATSRQVPFLVTCARIAAKAKARPRGKRTTRSRSRRRN